MIEKQPLCEERVRQVPKQFSWVDHRLVRDRHIEHLSHGAAALYLFLVTVADARGLSYYSDASIMRRLSMDESTLEHARQNLIRVDLIAYRKPLYQVLAIAAPARSDFSEKSTSPSDEPVSVARIFKDIMGGTHP